MVVLRGIVEDSQIIKMYSDKTCLFRVHLDNQKSFLLRTTRSLVPKEDDWVVATAGSDGHCVGLPETS